MRANYVTRLSSLLSFAFITQAGAQELLKPIDEAVTLHLHGYFAAGVTSADSAADLAAHGHDPNQEQTIQGIELGASLRPMEHVEGFVSINSFLTTEDKLDSELEEAFLKLVDLPLGFELRGGRYLNSFGAQNNVHLHSWDFVNANLSTSQFLGEDGLITEGGELSWFSEFDQGSFALSASYGNAVEHKHEGEDEHDHGDDHEHGDSVESAYFAEEVTTIRALLNYNWTDYYQNRLGLNYGFGDNGFGRNTDIYSIDYSFGWRENGLESGGQAVTLGAEYFHRDVEWALADEPDEKGSSGQSGFMARLDYDFLNNWRVSAGYEWIEGVKDGAEFDAATGETEYGFLTEERERYSLALTYHRELSEMWDVVTRVQYNHDELEDLGGEDSVWFQIGFNFGQGDETR